jgi:cholesterol oxidase
MASEHFDAVIVGSGFGGSVMAYRLAEAGYRVCVLERGKTYPPGSFARSPAAMSGNFWDPSAGLYGMYNVWSFRGLGSVVASGLGGGSLIYANVLIRKDEKWFVREEAATGHYEYWPVTRADLDPHYDQVEKKLDAQRYPYDHEPYARTPKTRAMKFAAERLALEWQLPNLAVTFASAGEPPLPGAPIKEQHPNLHGRTRNTCLLCGECSLGCNFGSKNTLDYNYLSAAKRQGAELRILCEAMSFAPQSAGGYAIRYRMLDPDRSSRDEPRPRESEITADALVLAAGTLGTNYLLLKNQTSFPGLSNRLGTRFCGNGDLLTVALRCQETDASGKKTARVLDPNYGPLITSAIRVGDAVDGEGASGRGYYIEDAGYPAFVGWLVEGTQVPGAFVRAVRFGIGWLRDRLHVRNPDIGAELSALLGPGSLSSSSLPLLGMGRDIPDGQMILSRGLLDVDWTTRASKDYFMQMRETMQAITREWGGQNRDNVVWYFNRVITVHALGGCLGTERGRRCRELIRGGVQSPRSLRRRRLRHARPGRSQPGPHDRCACKPFRRRDHRTAEGTGEHLTEEAYVARWHLHPRPAAFMPRVGDVSPERFHLFARFVNDISLTSSSTGWIG